MKIFAPALTFWASLFTFWLLYFDSVKQVNLSLITQTYHTIPLRMIHNYWGSKVYYQVCVLIALFLAIDFIRTRLLPIPSTLTYLDLDTIPSLRDGCELR